MPPPPMRFRPSKPSKLLPRKTGDALWDRTGFVGSELEHHRPRPTNRNHDVVITPVTARFGCVEDDRARDPAERATSGRLVRGVGGDSSDRGGLKRARARGPGQGGG